MLRNAYANQTSPLKWMGKCAGARNLCVFLIRYSWISKTAGYISAKRCCQHSYQKKKMLTHLKANIASPSLMLWIFALLYQKKNHFFLGFTKHLQARMTAMDIITLHQCDKCIFSYTQNIESCFYWTRPLVLLGCYRQIILSAALQGDQQAMEFHVASHLAGVLLSAPDPWPFPKWEVLQVFFQSSIVVIPHLV